MVRFIPARPHSPAFTIHSDNTPTAAQHVYILGMRDIELQAPILSEDRLRLHSGDRR